MADDICGVRASSPRDENDLVFQFDDPDNDNDRISSGGEKEDGTSPPISDHDSEKEDQIFANEDMEIYGVTPPRNVRRLKEKARSRKKTQEKSPVLLKSPDSRDNRDISFSSPSVSGKVEQDRKKKRESTLLKTERAFQRKLKMETGYELSGERNCPEVSKTADIPSIKIESTNRYMCLECEESTQDAHVFSKLCRSSSDPRSLSVGPRNLLSPHCPKEIEEFYRTFSLLIQLGSHQRESQISHGHSMGLERQSSAECKRWHVELSQALWLELQAWHANRTMQEQDRHLMEARAHVESVLDEVINFKVNRFESEVPEQSPSSLQCLTDEPSVEGHPASNGRMPGAATEESDVSLNSTHEGDGDSNLTYGDKAFDNDLDSSSHCVQDTMLRANEERTSPGVEEEAATETSVANCKEHVELPPDKDSVDHESVNGTVNSSPGKSHCVQDTMLHANKERTSPDVEEATAMETSVANCKEHVELPPDKDSVDHESVNGIVNSSPGKSHCVQDTMLHANEERTSPDVEEAAAMETSAANCEEHVELPQDKDSVDHESVNGTVSSSPGKSHCVQDTMFHANEERKRPDVEEEAATETSAANCEEHVELPQDKDSVDHESVNGTMSSSPGKSKNLPSRKKVAFRINTIKKQASREKPCKELEAAIEQVTVLFDHLQAVEHLYPTLCSLGEQNPKYCSDQFNRNLESLCLWLNLTKDLYQKLHVMAKFLGVDINQQEIWQDWLDIGLDSRGKDY